MKQSNDVRILLPGRPPKTIRAVERWHQKLLRDCAFFEFKKKALEAALNAVRVEVDRYSPHVRERAGLESEAKWVLETLNRLKRELSDELASAKLAVRMIHDTNEFIIGNLVQANGGREFIQDLQRQPAMKSTNLLHGEGWLLELLSAATLRRDGKAAFVTFGTRFDPAKIDVVAFDRPLRRVRWKLAWPRKRRWSKRVVRRLTSAST